LDEIFRKRERKERGDGASAHGGQIAESAGKGAMADGFGRVPVEAEVPAGDGEIGGDGELFIGSRTKQGAVVADAEAQFGGGDWAARRRILSSRANSPNGEGFDRFVACGMV